MHKTSDATECFPKDAFCFDAFSLQVYPMMTPMDSHRGCRGTGRELPAREFLADLQEMPQDFKTSAVSYIEEFSMRDLLQPVSHRGPAPQ